MIHKEAIISSAYLPPIQYVQILLRYKKVYLEKHETYPKQTYRNRCVIYTANGPLPLTIPVIKPNGNRTKTLDVQIDYSVKWRKEHWRALESAYKGSAFFEIVKDYFAPFYQKEWKFLWDYNLDIIKTVFNLLDTNLELIETKEFIKEYPKSVSDFRETITPKKPIDIFNQKPYFQVFSGKFGFKPNLSVFDLICNCGMDSYDILT
ncbi:MAG: WbqC family protein [Bacteroidales bacterium]